MKAHCSGLSVQQCLKLEDVRKLFTVKWNLEDEGDLQAQKIGECTQSCHEKRRSKLPALEGFHFEVTRVHQHWLEVKILISKPLLWKL